MKSKKYILLFVIIALFASSCKKGFFDINVSPNNPSDATPALVLPSAVASSAFVMGGYYQALGGFWTQQYAQSSGASQWETWETYNLADDDFDRQFTTLYAGALNDYKYVKDKAGASGDWKFYSIAALMQAYTFQVLADLYDKVPFTDALKGTEVIQPKYDDGQVVYDGLIAMIDDAMSKDFGSSTVKDPGVADVIFGGDMALWEQFANTLKLKIYMRYSKIDANKYRSQIATLLQEDNFLTSKDAAFSAFKAEQTGANPFYNTFIDRLANNVIANTTLMSRLTENDDPRRSALFNASATGGSWTSLSTGQFRTATGTSNNYATPNIDETYPVYFFSREEVFFMIAEAQARYGTVAAAQVAYNEGIKASLTGFGLSANAISYPYNGIKSIMEQKWIASTNKRSIEAFFDYNRTGYPDFFTESSISVIKGDRPRRLFYPSSERQSNSNTPSKEALTVPVWWAK